MNRGGHCALMFSITEVQVISEGLTTGTNTFIVNTVGFAGTKHVLNGSGVVEGNICLIKVKIERR